MSSIVKVDTIQENTSANGITVDGLNIKDSKLVTANSVVTSNITADAVTIDKLNLISTSSAPSLEAKGDGSSQDGYIQLNCSQNSHGIKLKSPAHSAGASYTLTFPPNDGDANQVLTTDGSGGLSFTTPASATNTPAFEATHNVLTGVTDNTYTKGNYITETFDTDGKYDTTNKRFTPTVAGKYYIYANAIFDAQGLDKFHSCQVAIYKNGSIYRKSYFDEYDNYLAYAKTPFLGTIVDMDTDDYVEAYILFNITTGTNHRVDNGGVFGGYKLIT